MTDEEIARRMPLWCALAELFLDTEMQAYNYHAIADASREGGFSVAEVRGVLENEVWPAFSFNLLDIAGEWAGFSDDYVRERMLEVLEGKNIWPVGDAWFRHRFLRTEWPKIEAALEGREFCLPAAPTPPRGGKGHVLTAVVCMAAILVGLFLILR